MMTGSDLCSSVKSWQNQLNTVQDIYNEFYTQGDMEIASGRLPVPIMNRFCRDDQALHQVGDGGDVWHVVDCRALTVDCRPVPSSCRATWRDPSVGDRYLSLTETMPRRCLPCRSVHIVVRMLSPVKYSISTTSPSIDLYLSSGWFLQWDLSTLL